jgi:hypothetical protein
MRTTNSSSSSSGKTMIASIVVFLWMTAAAKASAEDNGISALGTEEGFAMYPRPAIVEESPSLLLFLLEQEQEQLLPTAKQQHDASSSSLFASSSLLRGGVESETESELELPPIPPIHPVHTGSVQYSSVMEADGTVTYRRDIHAPCNYGMLVFNVGPSKDDLPYHYDLYGDAYLFSDNGGLCILYPMYTGYQVSPYGPFWRPGYDPTTVKFGDLVEGPRHMHRISSRILSPPSGGATQHSHEINRNKAGDYVIMGIHDFYGINYYKQLKDYVNSWGPNGPSKSDENNEIKNKRESESWVVTDVSTTTTTTILSEMR